MIVAVLLRSLIAPIYVIATVILSYGFALGVASLVFDKSDPAEPLFTFLFLVALGVDYNVFLLTRIKEAKRRMSHEDAVIEGLQRTGGVITSAGLILAGTFCTLLATELDVALPGRLHRRARPARGHVPDPDLPRAVDRPPSTIKGAMSENALRAAIVGAGPSGFYATDQLLKAGFDVDLLEVAADAVRPGARRRRARSPEDQERHARLREDREAPGLPLLRRRRARRRHLPRRTCSSATTWCSTRSAPRPTTGSASPARTGRARTRRPSSSPGTTATRTTPTTSSTSAATRAVVIGNGNVAVDVARMLVLDPDEVAVTDTADHAIERARRRAACTR